MFTHSTPCSFVVPSTVSVFLAPLGVDEVRGPIGPNRSIGNRSNRATHLSVILPRRMAEGALAESVAGTRRVRGAVLPAGPALSMSTAQRVAAGPARNGPPLPGPATSTACATVTAASWKSAKHRSPARQPQSAIQPPRPVSQGPCWQSTHTTVPAAPGLVPRQRPDARACGQGNPGAGWRRRVRRGRGIGCITGWACRSLQHCSGGHLVRAALQQHRNLLAHAASHDPVDHVLDRGDVAPIQLQQLVAWLKTSI